MITDELYRAVHALMACKGWSEEQALEHLLRMGDARRARVSEALKAWSVVAESGDGPRPGLEERVGEVARDMASSLWGPSGEARTPHAAGLDPGFEGPPVPGVPEPEVASPHTG